MKGLKGLIDELKRWADETNIIVFVIEVFDEPWKGYPDKPLGAEKHRGLFNVDWTLKLVFKESPAAMTR